MKSPLEIIRATYEGSSEENGKNLLASYGTPQGQSALIPAAGVNNYTQIQDAIARLNQ